MAVGGARVGAGRKKKNQPDIQVPENWKLKLKLAKDEHGLTSLEFMRAIYRDEELPRKERAVMAVAAAPYENAKPSDEKLGKKEKQQHEAESGHKDTGWDNLVH